MSVPNNIMEGCSRTSRAGFASFLEIALGSLNELEGHLLTGLDGGVFSSKTHGQLRMRLIVVRRMLIALIRKIQRDIADEENKRRSA